MYVSRFMLVAVVSMSIGVGIGAIATNAPVIANEKDAEAIQKWEYTTLSINGQPPRLDHGHFVKKGEAGWELAGTIGDDVSPMLIFKRPKQ